MKHIVILGRAERIDFPGTMITDVPAKVDTGAFRSSICACDIKEHDGMLEFKLFAPNLPWYSGEVMKTEQFELVEVENSFGHKEDRYSIYLKIKVANRIVKTNFTLSNRSEKTYPVLLGRRLLKNRFLVDVSKGTPIVDEELKSRGGLS